jgi:ABC-type amino acid transport substrate-binding protein
MKREDVIKQIIKQRTIHTLTPGVLRVAAYANFYPVCYRKNGKWRGLDVDLLKMFCKVAGLELELVERKRYDDIWFEPPDKKADTAIGGIANTDGRTKPNTAWSIPYFYVQRTLLYNKNDPVRRFPEDIDREVRATIGSTVGHDSRLA